MMFDSRLSMNRLRIFLIITYGDSLKHEVILCLLDILQFYCSSFILEYSRYLSDVPTIEFSLVDLCCSVRHFSNCISDCHIHFSDFLMQYRIPLTFMWSPL